MAQYGCARMTVHKAITALVSTGLVERRKKAGSFVAAPHVQTAVIEIPDIKSVIEGRGERYSFELLSRVLQRAGDADDRRPDIPGDRLILDGLHAAQGRPFCLEHRLVSLEAAPAAIGADFTSVAPGSWLLEHIPWTEARHRITACQAGDAAQALQIVRTSACLQVERWTWRQTQAVTFVRLLFPGDRYDLIAEFSPR